MEKQECPYTCCVPPAVTQQDSPEEGKLPVLGKQAQWTTTGFCHVFHRLEQGNIEIQMVLRAFLLLELLHTVHFLCGFIVVKVKPS